MSIDGIKSGGGALPATHGDSVVGGARGPEGAPFEVDPSARSVTGVTGAGSTPGLDALRSGQIDFATYLDQHVAQATAHLGALPADDLAFIRASLRDRLESDPGLSSLAMSAGGIAPAKEG